MRLHVFPVAPNPTKVRLYLAEKAAAGRPIALEEVTVSLPEGEQKSPAFRALNPMGKLPVLETDAGTVITESLAIIEYLEERYPEPSLFGDDLESRAIGRQLERIADLGVLIPLGRQVHATDSPLGLPPNPPVAEYHRDVAAANLDHLEALLGDGRPFLAGERVTVADCSLAAGLQFGRFKQIDAVGDRPRLRAWDERYRARESAQGVLVV